MAKRIIMLAACLALGACQTPAGQQVGASVQQAQQALTKFTVADLQSADADARAHGDTVASMCYEALIPVVQAQGTTPLPQPVGAISAFQAARDGANAVIGLPDNLRGLNISCGPLVVDAKATIMRLSAMISGGAITGVAFAGGALPIPIPGIP